MLAETVLAAARVARRFDEWVERPRTFVELRIEKPLAKTESGNEQLARPEFLDDLLEEHRRDRRARLARSGKRAREVAALGHPPEVTGPLRLHPIVMRGGNRKVGRDHVQLGKRAPRSADHVEGLVASCFGKPGLLQPAANHLAGLLLAGLSALDPQHAERKR